MNFKSSSLEKMKFHHSRKNIRMSSRTSIFTEIEFSKSGRFKSRRSEVSFTSTTSYGSHGIFNGANYLMLKLIFSTLILFMIALIVFLEVENSQKTAKNLNFKLARQAKRLFVDKNLLRQIYRSQFNATLPLRLK